MESNCSEIWFLHVKSVELFSASGESSMAHENLGEQILDLVGGRTDNRIRSPR